MPRWRGNEAATELRPIHGVPDDVYQQARARFSKEQPIDLDRAVIPITGWNRIAIASHAEPGSYQPATR